MKNLKKFLISLLVGAFVFSGCGNNKEETVKKEAPKKVEKEEEQVSLTTNENLLTGLDDLSEEAIGKRPVAVMINNIEPAMPQYGVEQADIIFEIPVEGDLTRFMALYGDYTKVPKICAIRSCRYYFPVFSQGFDAIYIFWGMDETVRDYVDNVMKVEYFDGMEDSNHLFGRDQSRLNAGYGLEHTAYFDGEKFADVVENKYRTDLNDEYRRPAFNFSDEVIQPSNKTCNTVDINFGAQSSTLEYDAERQVYLKKMNNKPQIDGKTNNPLAFTNVLVLNSSITMRDNGVHKKIDCFGGPDSSGYYISNGKIQKIHWEKKDNKAKSRLILYDDKGKEIQLNKGKTYIALNRKERTEFR